MAAVERTYVDPSALTPLYLHEEQSRAVSRWRARGVGPILVTHHGRTEVVNAICLASFTGEFDLNKREKALSRFAEDFVNGYLQLANLLWRAALDRAAELSEAYTPTLGTRSLDVLHVACALEMKMRYFLTFDTRQQKLAAAAGLKIVRL